MGFHTHTRTDATSPTMIATSSTHQNPTPKINFQFIISFPRDKYRVGRIYPIRFTTSRKRKNYSANAHLCNEDMLLYSYGSYHRTCHTSCRTPHRVVLRSRFGHLLSLLILSTNLSGRYDQSTHDLSIKQHTINLMFRPHSPARKTTNP